MGKKYRSVWCRCLATLLMAVMLLGNLGFLQEAEAATVEIPKEKFLEAVNKKNGNSTTPGMCLGWVRSFWVGLGAQSSTSCCAHNYSLGSGRIVSTSKSNIPVGANVYLRGGTTKCVYSNGSGCGRICGHVAIYIGDGKIISSRTLKGQSSCVGIETIAKWESWGYKFAGWGWHSGVKVVDDNVTTIDSKTRIGISTKPASGEDQCYVKEKPLEDSDDKSDSVPKGQTVKIVGAVKNKYGNTWYKTADGGFVWEGDVTVWEYSTLFSVSANFYTVKNQNSHAAPYADSDKIDAYPTGTIFKVKSFVTNSYGNVWVELSDGSYMNFYDKNADVQNVNFVSHVSQPTISGETKPTGNINVTNQGFWLKGTVKAEVPFLTLSTRIIDRETGKDVEGRSPTTIKPGNVKSVAISKDNDSKDLDSLTKFTNLPKGWYQYQLNAQFGFTYSGKTFQFGGTHNFITSDFTVGNPGTLVDNSISLTLRNAYYDENGNIKLDIGIQNDKHNMMGYEIQVESSEDIREVVALAIGDAAGGGLCEMGPVKNNKFIFNLAHSSASSASGSLGELTIVPSKKVDSIQFTLTCTRAFDVKDNTVTVKGLSKTFELNSVIPNSRIPGDATDDGIVDLRDALRIMKHLCGWDVTMNEKNAECTGDGVIDLRDALRIMKYLCGWDVVLK